MESARPSSPCPTWNVWYDNDYPSHLGSLALNKAHFTPGLNDIMIFITCIFTYLYFSFFLFYFIAILRKHSDSQVEMKRKEKKKEKNANVQLGILLSFHFTLYRSRKSTRVCTFFSKDNYKIIQGLISGTYFAMLYKQLFVHISSHIRQRRGAYA